MNEVDDLEGSALAVIFPSRRCFSSFAASEDLRLLPPFLEDDFDLPRAAGFSTTTTTSSSSFSSLSGSKNGSKLKLSKGNATGAIIFARWPDFPFHMNRFKCKTKTFGHSRFNDVRLVAEVTA